MDYGNSIKMNLKHKKFLIKLLISIVSIVVIWYIFIGITFWVNPNLICTTKINEDITWEIESYEPTETDPGGISINFLFSYEVWINTPLPFLHSFDGCHLKPTAEAILTNTSISDGRLNYPCTCYLALVPALYLPGVTQKSGSIHFWVNYTELSGIPEGLYTFKVDFAQTSTIKAYKTYLNVSDDQISIYSDDTVDFSFWFWSKIIITIGIIIGLILITYIGLVIIGKKKFNALDNQSLDYDSKR